MKKFVLYAFAILICFSFLEANIYAQADTQLSPAEIERIVKAFSAQEAQFRHALNSYAFKRDALVQRIGMGGQVTGEYHRVSTFTFDDNGLRYEKINYFPMSSMGENITKEDVDDLGGISPFALDPAKINLYNFKYMGKEKIDELDLYVFDVSPKVMPSPKRVEDRMFLGRIWVDDRDFQIVKTKGKGVPETKQNKFPIVETYREQIDGRYWFPTYSYADDELIFDSGDTLHLRMKVKYYDFTPARATLKVTEVGESDSSNPSSDTAPAKGVAKPVEMGELNKKAVILPKPTYPEEARRLRASGKVIVKVLIDENGNVISATASDGPAPLRAAAEEAARLAKFEPVIEGGITVKVSGFLTYVFTP
ncbi:MAG TPA: TonB family protein [Pyrinomonadaceae bacterium]